MLFDPGCSDCGCPPAGLCAVYTIYGCGTGAGYELAGANVRIRSASGGTIVASGVTDSAGQVTLCVPTSATRWLEADLPGRYANQGVSIATNATNRSLTINSVTSFGKCCLGSIAQWCSPPYLERGPIYLTDANGTWPPDTTCGVQWTTLAPADVWVCSCSPTSRTVERRNVRVIYQAGWSGGGVFVTRRWAEGRPAGCSFGEDVSGLAWLPRAHPPACFDSSDLITPQSNGTSATHGGSCSSPIWTVSLAQVGGIAPDPVGGGVVLSF